MEFIFDYHGTPNQESISILGKTSIRNKVISFLAVFLKIVYFFLILHSFKGYFPFMVITKYWLIPHVVQNILDPVSTGLPWCLRQ